MMTGAESLGIEVQAAYVASARECAQSLHLSRVGFIPQDANETWLKASALPDTARITVFDSQ